MGRFFAPNFGELEITPFSADNEIYCQEVRFSVPASEWNEFLKSDLFRELEAYVGSLKTPDMHTGIHENSPSFYSAIAEACK